MIPDLTQLLTFIHLAEGLKREIRHSFLSDGRPESVAEHVWRTTLIGVLFRPYLAAAVNIDRVVAMLVVHDLVEVFAGDVPAFAVDAQRDLKPANEERAMQRIVEQLPIEVGNEIEALWREFESNRTVEAVTAQVIDKVEAQIQHNEADFSTWLPLEHERVFTFLKECIAPEFLTQFVEHVRNEAIDKLKSGNIDPESVRQRSIGIRETPDE